MSRLRVEAGTVSFEIELGDTPNARALVAAAPFESQAQTWGDEVYFSTPVSAKLEPGAKQVVVAPKKQAWEASLGGEVAARPHVRARLAAFPDRIVAPRPPRDEPGRASPPARARSTSPPASARPWTRSRTSSGRRRRRRSSEPSSKSSVSESEF